jgi:hypothetical protein
MKMNEIINHIKSAKADLVKLHKDNATTKTKMAIIVLDDALKWLNKPEQEQNND